MHKLFCLIALVGAGVIGCATSNTLQPQAILFNGFNGSGESIALHATYNSDLNSKDFDNQTLSVCLAGAWLFYTEHNYNLEGGGMEYVYRPSYKCANLATLGGRVRSVRFAGPAENYQGDSITFYSRTYFEGKEEFFRNSSNALAVVRKTSSSIIITGSSNWTVYDDVNFQGSYQCILMQPSADVIPKFIEDTTKLGIPHGTIRSVRKGC